MPDEKNEDQPQPPVQLLGYPARYRGLSFPCGEDSPHAELRDWKDGKIENVMLWGPVGAGKTYLAAAAMNTSRLDKSYFIPVPMMLLEFQAGVKEHDEIELIRKYSAGESNWNKTYSIGRLFDDVGAHRISDFGIEMFGLLLERFYSNCQTGMIFTSNLSPKQILETMGERVSSRLCGLCKTVEVAGKDRRVNP